MGDRRMEVERTPRPDTPLTRRDLGQHARNASRRRQVRPVLPALALLALLAAAGCVQKPKYEPMPVDSTATVPVDSLAIIARSALEMWDTPDQGEAASALSARLLLTDLAIRSRVEPTLSWEERARGLLDSLGFGGEVMSDRCVMVVNFFSRSDPERGAWPWLFWCGQGTILSEPLDARAFKLLALAGRGLFGDPPTPPGPPSAAVLFGRRTAGGQQLLLTSWDLAGTSANLAQTLGPDSLGGVGRGEFSGIEDGTIQLTTRTYRGTPGFTECATCPHVWQARRFLWEPYGFERIAVEREPSPYATFVAFAQALAVDDRDRARELVVDREWVETARRQGWGEPGGTWRVAPGTDEKADEMVFFRGPREAYRVTFEQRGGEWLIAGFRTTSTSIE